MTSRLIVSSAINIEDPHYARAGGIDTDLRWRQKGDLVETYNPEHSRFDLYDEYLIKTDVNQDTHISLNASVSTWTASEKTRRPNAEPTIKSSPHLDLFRLERNNSMRWL